MDERILWNLSYGVYVVSTINGDKPTGCIANSVMQVTAIPATIAVSMHHDNFTHSCIRSSGHFSISILSEDCKPAILARFGFQSGKNIDKFQGIEYKEIHGMPVLTDSIGYMNCKVISSMDVGTHTIFVGEVEDAECFSESCPMTYAYYHQVRKGKTPENATTYRTK